MRRLYSKINELQKSSSCREPKVLENEVKLTGIFVRVLENLVEEGSLQQMDKNSIELMAHNITVLGHMWTFSRWFLASRYSIEEYINFQTDFVLGRMGKEKK